MRPIPALALLLGIVCLLAAASPLTGGLRCSSCGAPITGGYFKTNGRYYHPGCFRCAHCDQPIQGPYLTFKSRNYHRECYRDHVALKCSVCGGIIEGEYKVDFWGNKYHPEHEKDVLRCDFCRRFIVGDLVSGARRMPDGRHLCAYCTLSSVTARREVERLARGVAREIRRYGFKVDPAKVVFKLVGKDKLRKLSPRSSGDMTGLVEYRARRTLFGRTTSKRATIYLLYGMPRVQARAAIAHELAHLWQLENCPPGMDKILAEGSAEYASYLVLRRDGSDEARFVLDSMELNDNPIYGGGFNLVRDYAERKGLAALIEVLQDGRTTASSLAP